MTTERLDPQAREMRDRKPGVMKEAAMFRVQYPWFGGPDVLRVGDAPVPGPGDHDVLVRVRAASINPTDAKKRSGALRVSYLREPRPYGMGMDVAGEVLEVGSAVSGVKVGDRVLGMTKGGDGFAEQTLVRDRDAVVFGPGITFAQAASVAMSGSTAQVLRRGVTARPGSRVLVNGAAGGIGHFLVQLLGLDGFEVTGTASGAGLDVLGALGIPEVLDYRGYDPASLAGRFSAIIDLPGKLTARHGRSMLADPGTFRTTVPGASVMLGAATTAFGSRKVGPVFAIPDAASSRAVLGLVEAGEVSIKIGAERPLTEAIDTIAAVESGALKVPGKVVLMA